MGIHTYWVNPSSRQIKFFIPNLMFFWGQVSKIWPHQIVKFGCAKGSFWMSRRQFLNELEKMFRRILRIFQNFSKKKILEQLLTADLKTIFFLVGGRAEWSCPTLRPILCPIFRPLSSKVLSAPGTKDNRTELPPVPKGRVVL